MDRDTEAVNALRTRMAQSRGELRELLEPPVAPVDSQGRPSASGFPRSRTMQLLMSNRGLGALGVLAGGFLVARPGLVLRLLRFLPAGTIAKLVIARGLSMFNKAPRNTQH